MVNLCYSSTFNLINAKATANKTYSKIRSTNKDQPVYTSRNSYKNKLIHLKYMCVYGRINFDVKNGFKLGRTDLWKI